MTALRKYERLESPGSWRARLGAPLREVVVAFREATLVLSDPKTEMALSHWSLPAVERLNPGSLPAIFGPGGDPSETLEIDDADMIAALDTVRQVLARRRPRPGRLRGVILTLAAVSVVGLGVFWMPGALVRHTASVLPEATRIRIGQMALADVTRLSGSPCAAPLGRAAAAKLAMRLFGPEADILVLREGLAPVTALPGGLILLNRALVESAADAETPAGFALAAAAQAAQLDPMLALLQHAGLAATFRLLTTGALPDGALTGYAETLLQTPAPTDADLLLPRFDAARLSPAAYAYALDVTGESTLALIEGDPFHGTTPKPLLDDGDWISLQDICAK